MGGRRREGIPTKKEEIKPKRAKPSDHVPTSEGTHGCYILGCSKGSSTAFVFVALHSMWYLSSPARDQTKINCTLRWKGGVLTTGLPGQFPSAV